MAAQWATWRPLLVLIGCRVDRRTGNVAGFIFRRRAVAVSVDFGGCAVEKLWAVCASMGWVRVWCWFCPLPRKVLRRLLVASGGIIAPVIWSIALGGLARRGMLLTVFPVCFRLLGFFGAGGAVGAALAEHRHDIFNTGKVSLCPRLWGRGCRTRVVQPLYVSTRRTAWRRVVLRHPWRQPCSLFIINLCLPAIAEWLPFPK